MIFGVFGIRQTQLTGSEGTRSLRDQLLWPCRQLHPRIQADGALGGQADTPQRWSQSAGSKVQRG